MENGRAVLNVAPTASFVFIFYCGICFLTNAAMVLSENSTANNVFQPDATSRAPTLYYAGLSSNNTNGTLQNDSNILLNRKNSFHARVVGGVQAEKGRYPYMVSILTAGASEGMPPACGGSLIAPDLVLTAAHCISSRLGSVQVGRYDRSDPSEQYDHFTIAQQIPHPKYQSENLDYDIMLLKLSGESDNPLLTLNRDPTIPKDNNNDEMVVMGFGVTQSQGIYASQTLQVGTVDHVPNDICAQASFTNTAEMYRDKITDDMLCAQGRKGPASVDACQGDSGSPLIMKGQSVQQDVQIGIVSWGYRCAHPDFPGVYSRISYHLEWIANQVCQVSENPPAPFKCSSPLLPSSNVAQQTERRPVASDQGYVPVKLRIIFDDYASEISWTLKDSSGFDVAAAPFKWYENGRERAERTFFLVERETYFFSIQDSYRDGLCCRSPGSYMMVVSGQGYEGEILLFGEGNFGATANHEFTVPALDNIGEGDISNYIAASLQQSPGTISLEIFLELDGEPGEIGWTIERLGFNDEIVAQAPAGYYRNPNQHVLDSIDLQEGEMYRFTLVDEGRNGLHQGRVQLFLHNRSEGREERMVLDHNGRLKQALDHVFMALLVDDVSSGAVTSSGSYLTLELRFDLYPEEIGFQLRADTLVGAVAIQKRASSIIFFRAPGFYDSRHTNQVVRETIALPTDEAGSVKHYSLILLDSFGDGLCCDWNGHLKNPGYTLYDGSYQRGAILVSSSFSKSPREVYSFGIIHMESGYPAYEFAAFPSFQPSSEEISLTVAIKTSTQAGYTIEDYDGKPVVSVPPGSFRGQSANVQEKHTVFRGVYFFSMIHNDGVILSDTSTDTCTYDVYVEANENRPPLLSGTPCLETERRQAFVLEGSYATIPVLVRVSGVLSGHFIFQIRRLDLSEADAVVATIRLDRETHVSDDSGLSSRFFVEDGGVYRLVPLGVSEHDQLTGSVRLTVGSHKNVIEADIIQQPKFLAGSDFHSTAPPINHAVSEKFLSLTIPTELGPSEIDWVLLSLNIENGKRIRRVISYGPGDKNNIRHYVLFSYSTVETIPLPSFDENPTLMLILSHSGGEDCCEQKSANGLIKLFQGPPEDGLILLGTTFEGESRLVEIFHLDTPGSPQSAANSIMNFGAAGRRGLLLLGSFLFVMFCYEL